MYQQSYPDTSPLDKWKNKKYGNLVQFALVLIFLSKSFLIHLFIFFYLLNSIFVLKILTNKTLGLMFGTPSPPPRSYSEFSSYRTESSLEPSPLPRTPISDYKIKLTTSRKIPGCTQNFEIPITRSLYLKLKNRSAISPVTGELTPSEEIDYLTTLLMDSLANSDDPHIIGKALVFYR